MDRAAFLKRAGMAVAAAVVGPGRALKPSIASLGIDSPADDMVHLAGDLASFSNLGTTEVLEAMNSALVGSPGHLRALFEAAAHATAGLPG